VKAIRWGKFKVGADLYYVGPNHIKIEFGAAVKLIGLWSQEPNELLEVQFGNEEPIGVPFEHLSHHEASDLTVIQIAKKGNYNLKEAPPITEKYSNDLQAHIWAIFPGSQRFKTFFPEAALSYSTGTRPGIDIQGGGPGMLMAADILDEFHNANIEMASGLQVQTGGDWTDLLPKIGGRHSKCRVLVILQNKAFYASKPCLREVYKAITQKALLFPVRCEDPLPGEKNQWTGIEAGSEDETMLDKVQEALGKINSFPPRGLFFSNPDYMAQLIRQIKEKLAAPVGNGNNP